MRFLNNRGESSETILYYLVFGLILAAFFAFAVMSKVRSATNDSTYQKRFYSADLALLTDSLHASNGNFSISYDIITPDNMQLDVLVAKDKVILTDASNAPVDSRPQTYFLYGYNDYTTVKSSVINQNLVQLTVNS